MRYCLYSPRGFTFIELLITLVLVGLLAALALPRFSDVSDEAELAQVQGVAAALHSGVKLARTVFLSQGHTTRVQNLPGFGAGNVDTNNSGFPIGIDKGNGNENIGRGPRGCAGVWNGVLNMAPSVAHNTSALDYQAYRHTGNRVCSYVYRAGGDGGNRNTAQLVIEYDSRDGSVRVCGQHPRLPGC
ncbi:hypothetical protein GCM10011297_27980 [Bacterioplanes sanyensis]|uniref:pilus assembly FimT family protein n=1 Tax=Bacterioplanes sanyensis TaxID=1249553 RepID=UPI0016743BDA|nr:prepilin-type N-terminal cleavage/methylation domain-containing protein [Bacterioplanes sanyensis]GGY53540.1 hypothetical protein GCM10011297_27980 [Bacterioplanes sanyensis]